MTEADSLSYQGPIYTLVNVVAYGLHISFINYLAIFDMVKESGQVLVLKK